MAWHLRRLPASCALVVACAGLGGIPDVAGTPIATPPPAHRAGTPTGAPHLAHHAGKPKPLRRHTRRSGTVTVTYDAARVTFTNDGGSWTIAKECTADAGPGYVSKYITPDGYVAVRPGPNGEPGGYVDPRYAGLGVFGYDEAKGLAPYPHTGNRNWNVSLRRCGAFGLVRADPPTFGIDGNGTGYYDQVLYVTDGWKSLDTTLHYNWRFSPSSAELYVRTSVKTGPGSANMYIKAPMFVSGINGHLSQNAVTHMSTITTDGRYLSSPASSGSCSELGGTDANCTVGGYRCSWDPVPGTTPYLTTGKCYDPRRATTRFDYGTALDGGCNNTSQVCLDVTAAAYPVVDGNVEPGRPSLPWEAGAGFDAWALQAAGRAAAGSGVCQSQGDTISSTDQQLARDWEMTAFTDSAGRFLSANVMDKAWDNCVNLFDAPALFRNVGPGEYGSHLTFSLDTGSGTPAVAAHRHSDRALR